MFWDFLHQPALEKRRGNIGGPISRYDFDLDGLVKVEGGQGGQWEGSGSFVPNADRSAW